MEPRATEAIIETFWATPGEHVYAVLDAARDPAVRANSFSSIIPQCPAMRNQDSA